MMRLMALLPMSMPNFLGEAFDFFSVPYSWVMSICPFGVNNVTQPRLTSPVQLSMISHATPQFHIWAVLPDEQTMIFHLLNDEQMSN